MSKLAVTITKTAHRPRDIVSGTVGWEFPSAPRALEVRLFWFTRGKGMPDAGIADKRRIEQPLARGSQPFELRLPDVPFSFSGTLVSLIWAVEIVAEPGPESARAEIVMSPSGSEIVLPRIETAEDRTRAKWERRLGGVTNGAGAR